MSKIKHKKGEVEIIIAVMVLSFTLSVGLAMSQWIVIGFNLTQSSYISAPAYYAAESGIEKTLYKITAKGGPNQQPSAVGSGEALDENNDYLSDTFDYTSYGVWIISTNPFKARAIGTSKTLKRGIDINWEKYW